MPYLTMADLEGRIPTAHLIEALDDNGDGQADASALTAVLQDAENGVDGILEGKFTVPFENPLPKVVIDAARVFACEIIHQRRGKSAADNPFTKSADAARLLLGKIAAGELPITPVKARATASGAVISAPAKTASARTAV